MNISTADQKKLVAKLVTEANEEVRIRHCGRKTFSENPVWRGIRVDAVNDFDTFKFAHSVVDVLKAVFAVLNENGSWRELTAEEAWPIYEEAFVSNRCHGFIFESDYHESYSGGDSQTRRALSDRLVDEADLCRNEGASDIAALLDEAGAALGGAA